MLNKKKKVSYKVKLRRPKNILITELFEYLGKTSRPPLRTVRTNKFKTKACILFMQCIYLLCVIFTIIFGYFPTIRT